MNVTKYNYDELQEIQKLPDGEWIANWSENGDFFIASRQDVIDRICDALAEDYWEFFDDNLAGAQGFKSHKAARLYCLKFLRSWRDEIADSVKELTRLKEND